MAYLTNLADIARRTGFPVVEEWGWKQRGHGSFNAVRSVIAHHDAANHRPDQFNSVIRDGHSSLAGPLSQFALRRDGTIHVVAAGVAWHAGSNINDAIYGNYNSIGIEAGNNGVGEHWPQVQIDAYVALCAELCKAFGLPASRVQGHKEIAPDRKIDPAGIHMPTFRTWVTRHMNGEDELSFENAKNGALAALREVLNTKWHEPGRPGDQPDVSLSHAILATNDMVYETLRKDHKNAAGKAYNANENWTNTNDRLVSVEADLAEIKSLLRKLADSE